ncbi:MAG: hypothetical protein HOF38_04195 [Elusimicrobiaceae bacterium]|nr:hypothetical protein [Elusimicrobiaceae bacterium]MBT3955339.1 hypothetical protein [Elusimicrobiaceae bacterium]MBT4403363.1 hypothetical protein [Elusimicrobiaceae bacterium]
MKKLTIILSVALLLTSVSGYATPTINKMVETKVDQAEVMLALPPIPVKVPGALIKLVIEVFAEVCKKTGKAPSEISYEKMIREILDLDKKLIDDLIIVLKNIPTNKRGAPLDFQEMLGYAIIEELKALGKEIPVNFNTKEVGGRIVTVYSIFGDNIVHNKKDLENLYYIVRGAEELEMAIKLYSPELNCSTLDQVTAEIKKLVNEISTFQQEDNGYKFDFLTYKEIKLKNNNMFVSKNPRILEELEFELREIQKELWQILHKLDELRHPTGSRSAEELKKDTEQINKMYMEIEQQNKKMIKIKKELNEMNDIDLGMKN